METSGNEDPRYQRAKARVEELKGFYAHLAVYVVVIGGLFLIDLATGDGWWFFWPLLGWGIAIAIHAVMLFGVEGPLGAKWEERKIRQLMEKDRQLGHS